ncbi:SUMF1/EgtB/PvdO family nonheme iron enzyme [Micromonospora sp. STR1_7]|uniref:SUMF1/EgtB/PvdO family nonheme iron enzyme n=1 Tax=Micromonospora parastrephiae TaxID=2806101 RepID=A0ABS1XN52_9ACTN|nr:SUMF1/EgtB/PvdO family nonheme iron enzyme [Micromonospora parastrephiae]MBM0230686.1 SUMF1/EgtB/PvdO family nonheme iron enzyme [Micromonospora parastrephiae]
MRQIDKQSLSVTVPGCGFNLIEFGARTFEMGFPERAFRAAPVHEVTLDAFLLGDRCVSAGDFARFLADTPGAVDHMMIDCVDPGFFVHRAAGFVLRPGCADFPMIQISFWAAAAYCNWLSDAEGARRVYDVAARTVDYTADGFRLPTEAEWEAACRVGWGAAPAVDPDLHNSLDAGSRMAAMRAGVSLAGNFSSAEPTPVPVTAPVPDAAGLHHMLGNVREWCQDRFGPYRSDPVSNPHGPAEGSFRVVRGGSYGEALATMSAVSRLAAFEGTRCEVYGFRVARSAGNLVTVAG